MPDSSTTLSDLKKLVEDFVKERNWQHFHDAKNLAMSTAIEAAELMEHFQWLTSAQVREQVSEEQAETRKTDTDDLELVFDRQAVAEEMADVACYLLGLASLLDIDLSDAISQKMIKNRQKYPVGATETRYGRPTNKPSS